jgi:signal transduction histidine kinase
MTDQRMPEMTGVEFLMRLRETHPDVVRLLFTAYADLQAVVDAINQGSVYRYVTKPWEPSELQTTLRQAAEHYDLLSERKRLLSELRQKNEQLESANAELRQANELKKAFIKVASHELRTPLTIVLGLADLARKTPGVEGQLHQWLERIYSGSTRLSDRMDLMNKLLLSDRFDRPLDPQPVVLADLVKAAAADVATFVQQRRQTLEVDVSGARGTIQAEEDKLRDSVFQLLINAVKFTPDGGTVRLAARTRPDGGAEISVSDTGMGVDPASLPHLFDPFFTRFDVSKHSSGVYEFDRRGLGLGLTVAKAFVEMHGGRLRAASQVGKGSTFTIELPAKVEAPHAEAGHGI